MNNALPRAKRSFTEIIKGKRLQKQIYPDDSYGICESDKVTRYFSDGKVQIYKIGSDNETFILNSEKLPDGTRRQWNRFGQIHFEETAEGARRYWFENGQMELETLSDGTEREWYADGHMKRTRLPNGTLIEWQHYKKAYGVGGNLKNETINGRLVREWYESGQLAYARSPNGKEIRFNEFGEVIYHAIRGVEDTQEYLAKKRVAKQQLELNKNLRRTADLQDDSVLLVSKSENAEDAEISGIMEAAE